MGDVGRADVSRGLFIAVLNNNVDQLIDNRFF
jgi:hypothetical protein